MKPIFFSHTHSQKLKKTKRIELSTFAESQHEAISMKWKQAIENFIHDFRAKKKEDDITVSKERYQKTLEVARYMSQFDVEKVELKKSPLGGWMCTFDGEDPTETDHSEEDSFGMDNLGFITETRISQQRISD